MRLLSDITDTSRFSVRDLGTMRKSILNRIAVIDLGHGDRQEFIDILKLRLEEIDILISKKRQENVENFFHKEF